MPFRREALGCCWLNGALMEREALAWRQRCAFDRDVEGWTRMLLLIQVIQRWGGQLWPVVSKKPFGRVWVLSFGLDKERSEWKLHAGKLWAQTGGLAYGSRVHVGRIGSGRQAETTWRPCLTLVGAWLHLPVLQQPQGAAVSTAMNVWTAGGLGEGPPAPVKRPHGGILSSSPRPGVCSPTWEA